MHNIEMQHLHELLHEIKESIIRIETRLEGGWISPEDQKSLDSIERRQRRMANRLSAIDAQT